MTNEQLLVATALAAWKLNIERAEKLFFNLPGEKLQVEIAPGKNRLIYLWGHLTAVHDRMITALSLGERVRPEFDAVFISAPDKTSTLPSAQEIKQAWDEVNARLLKGFDSLTPADWLKKHSTVSDEDFAKEPLRNRYAILLSRTSHLAYHLGQAVLAPQ
jgi:hypothetical protein